VSTEPGRTGTLSNYWDRNLNFTGGDQKVQGRTEGKGCSLLRQDRGEKGRTSRGEKPPEVQGVGPPMLLATGGGTTCGENA